jgi:amphiphysin
MNTVQRQFGKLTHRGGGDDAKVSVLLQEFEDADKMLTKV